MSWNFSINPFGLCFRSNESEEIDAQVTPQLHRDEYRSSELTGFDFITGDGAKNEEMRRCNLDVERKNKLSVEEDNSLNLVCGPGVNVISGVSLATDKEEMERDINAQDKWLCASLMECFAFLAGGMKDIFSVTELKPVVDKVVNRGAVSAIAADLEKNVPALGEDTSFEISVVAVSQVESFVFGLGENRKKVVDGWLSDISNIISRKFIQELVPGIYENTAEDISRVFLPAVVHGKSKIGKVGANICNYLPKFVLMNLLLGEELVVKKFWARQISGALVSVMMSDENALRLQANKFLGFGVRSGAVKSLLYCFPGMEASNAVKLSIVFYPVVESGVKKISSSMVGYIEDMLMELIFPKEAMMSLFDDQEKYRR